MSAAELYTLDRPATKTRKRKQVTRKAIKKIKARMSPVKIGIGAMIVALLAVTLTHSSEGVILLTGCPIWQGWALAAAIDGLYGAVKAAMLTHPECDKRVGNALIAGSLAVSGYLNALAMSHGNLDIDHVTQVGFGLAIPLGIFGASVFMARLK